MKLALTMLVFFGGTGATLCFLSYGRDGQRNLAMVMITVVMWLGTAMLAFCLMSKRPPPVVTQPGCAPSGTQAMWCLASYDADTMETHTVLTDVGGTGVLILRPARTPSEIIPMGGE